MPSKIEWTDETWNVVTGCTKVSAGCTHCYAERMSKRLAGRCGYPKDDPFRVTLHPDKLDKPLKWKKPRKIFVNSMSDLFHEDVPDEFIDEVFAVMSDAGQHTFMILTKRPERMKQYLSLDNPRYTARKVFNLTKDPAGKFDCDLHWPLINVWLGTSVENQAAADERIPPLLQVPAAVKFISVEPLLGPVDLMSVQFGKYTTMNVLEGCGISLKSPCQSIPNAFSNKIDWVITGGESGPGARPLHPDWVRSLRDQCQAAGTKFFFKSWGDWLPNAQEYDCNPGGVDYEQKHELVRNVAMCRVGKKKSGRLIDGRTWDEMPEIGGQHA